MNIETLLDRSQPADIKTLRAVVTEMTDLFIKKSSANIIRVGVHPHLPLMTVAFSKPKDPDAPASYYVYEAQPATLEMARDANRWEAMMEDPKFSLGTWRRQDLCGRYSHPFTMEDEE